MGVDEPGTFADRTARWNSHHAAVMAGNGGDVESYYIVLMFYDEKKYASLQLSNVASQDCTARRATRLRSSPQKCQLYWRYLYVDRYT